MPGRISEAVIRRLPRYHRALKALMQSQVQRVSSAALAQAMNTTASQVRQDLNCFGGFGQQGYGYTVNDLCDQIAAIIGLDRSYGMIVLGAGNIGQALASYADFPGQGYSILALFDVNPALIGQSVNGIEVKDIARLEEFAAANTVDIAVIAVPGAHAAALAGRVADCGISAIWNFAPTDIVLANVAVENVHLTDSLMTLTYRLRKGR